MSPPDEPATAAAGGPGAPEVELSVIVTARVPMPYGYVYRPHGSAVSRLRSVLKSTSSRLTAPCLAYVVKHPAAGTILIDTGMHPDARSHPRRDFGPVMSLMFRSLRPAATPYGEQLRWLGVAPEQVESAVMTHLHVDHTGGMRLLPRARFICARGEWMSAHGRLAAARGYVAHHLPAAERVTLLDPERDGDPFGPFRRTLDLLGDGSVRLISTPGHTPGHLSVLLRVAGSRQVLVVGDAAYTRRSIDEQLLPLLTDDDAASLRSLAELKRFSQEVPEAILVPTHDPEAWRALAGVAAVWDEAALTAGGEEAGEGPSPGV